MANIDELNLTFTDGVTRIDATLLYTFQNKINEVVRKVNSEEPPVPITVNAPIITINNRVVTISCTTIDADIYYTTDNNTPTSESNLYSTPFTPTIGTTQIKAIAIKDGVSSSVTTESYSSTSPEAAAVLAKFAALSSAQSEKVKTLIDTLVDASIYSKIHYLSMPTVASTVAEAVQNILSDVTPPTVESGVVNNGLYTEELVDLTDMLVGNIDYDNYSLAYSIQLNAGQTGNTATIVRLSSLSSGTPSRVFQTVGDSPKVNYTGYKASGHPVAADSTSAVFTQINSHDKANSVEKWFDVNGQLTSGADDSTAPTNNGLSINTNSASTTYNVKFVGKYKFIMLSDCLTDAQLNALKSAIDTFLA